MKIHTDPDKLKELEADSRGRITLGSDMAEHNVKLLVLTEPEGESQSSSGKRYYQNHSPADGWDEARKKALERDGNKCLECGISQEEHRADESRFGGLHVHHIEPADDFEDKTEAHRLDNLLTLCDEHHGIAEREGIEALGSDFGAPAD